MLRQTDAVVTTTESFPHIAGLCKMRFQDPLLVSFFGSGGWLGTQFWLLFGVSGCCFCSFSRAWNHVKHVVLRLGGLEIQRTMHARTLAKYEVLARENAFPSIWLRL